MLATGIKTPVGIKVAGPDLDVIARVGEDIERIIRTVPGTASVYAERVTGGRYVDIDVNRLAAARFGLNIADVHDIVRSAIGGMNVSESVEGLERYPINLRYPRDARSSLEEIRNLPIVTPMGAEIPLSAVADIRIADGPGVIRSENARLNGWIYVDIAGRDLGSYVADAQQAVAEKLDLPPGYSLAWSGQYEYMERAKARLTMVVPFILMMIFLLLFINFRNLVSVLIIMGSLPLALVGGVWLLYLLGYNMSVAIGVGFIALAGVAVEIGVLMLLYIDQSLRRHRAEAAAERRPFGAEELRVAIVDGALMRVRPIMMTSMVIIAGLLPIMLGSGTGSEVMRRIAAPMVGGMVSATILTLLVVPALYTLWRQRQLNRGQLDSPVEAE